MVTITSFVLNYIMKVDVRQLCTDDNDETF